MRYQIAGLSQRTAIALTAFFLLFIHAADPSGRPAADKSLKNEANTALLYSKVKAKDVIPATRAFIAKSYGNLPLSFEANNGQVDGAVKFLSKGNGYTLFLTPAEAVLSVRRGSPKGKQQIWGTNPKADESKPLANDVVRLKVIGANPIPKISGLYELPGKSNYFIGNDPAKWRTDVSNFRKVKIEDVYPGIDLFYYGNQQHLEYDWSVKPGADPKVIRFEIEGNAVLKIDSQGNLILDESAALRLNKPVIYQDRAAVRTEISGTYAFLEKGGIGFQLDNYDASLPLIIDPVLSYSSYLGGNEGWDEGKGIALDSFGNAYVTGLTSSTDFPTENPLQGSCAEVFCADAGDAFVAKLNTSGNALVYSTYLGGRSHYGPFDAGTAIAVDSFGNAYVTGYTSGNFPTVNPFQATHGGDYSDAFVAKLNSTGNALIYSTYLGCSGWDEGRGIAVDSFGNAYVTGRSAVSSVDYDGFPLANAFQPSFGGGESDAFVAKFNASGDALVYSTYLGGLGSDEGEGIAVDSYGNAYVTGNTKSTDFPTASPFQAICGGGCSWNWYDFGDAFVTKFNASGDALVYSTYLGGLGSDEGEGIAVDSSGSAYVEGTTNSVDFPTENPFQASFGGGASDVFVTKLNALGTGLVYSTYLGGNGIDSRSPVWDGTCGIAVDSFGNAYVTGTTTSTDFPTENPFQACFGGGDSDAFVTKLNASGNALVYSSYLGGSDIDYGNGLSLDSFGNAYVIGTTDSVDFPTENPFQPESAGGDAFVTKIGSSAVTITANDPTATEAGSTTGQFTITRTGEPTSALTVHFSVGGTAISGSDYSSIGTSATIPVGEASVIITVTPINDTAIENDETVVISLSADLAYTVFSPDNATVTIISDDGSLPKVTIKANDSTATEAGLTTGSFRIFRTGATTSSLKVYFSVSGTATSGTDYSSLGTSVTIPAGSASQTKTVAPINDTTVEGDETVVVTLSSNAAYTVGTPNSATVTIIDDDVAATTVTIAADVSTATEAGPTAGRFTITRSGATTSPLAVHFSVAGTATAGSDYSSIGTSVTIPAGAALQTIAVTAINDTAVENDETVIVTLSAEAEYTVGLPKNATVTITSDDGSFVTIQANDPTATEAGPTTGSFRIFRTGATTNSLRVYFTVSGTATSGGDYASIGTSVTIPAGSASQTKTVTVINDSLAEGNETVVVTLSPDAAYAVGSPNSATVTITDND